MNEKTASEMTTAELLRGLATPIEEIMHPAQTEQTPPRIGKYGQMAMDFLKQTDPSRLNLLMMEGKHRDVFAQADEDANDRLEILMEQLRQQTPPPQTDSFLELARYNNQIHDTAEEIVLTEIVYKAR